MASDSPEMTRAALTFLLEAERAIEAELHPMDYWDAHTAQTTRIDAIKRALARFDEQVPA